MLLGGAQRCSLTVLPGSLQVALTLFFKLVSFEMPRFSCEFVCVHDLAVPLPRKKPFWSAYGLADPEAGQKGILG